MHWRVCRSHGQCYVCGLFLIHMWGPFQMGPLTKQSQDGQIVPDWMTHRDLQGLVVNVELLTTWPHDSAWRSEIYAKMFYMQVSTASAQTTRPLPLGTSPGSHQHPWLLSHESAPDRAQWRAHGAPLPQSPSISRRACVSTADTASADLIANTGNSGFFHVLTEASRVSDPYTGHTGRQQPP